MDIYKEAKDQPKPVCVEHLSRPSTERQLRSFELDYRLAKGDSGKHQIHIQENYVFKVKKAKEPVQVGNVFVKG